MSAFSTAISTIFADPNMAVEATYLPSGFPPGYTVRVIRRRPDEMTDYGTARLVQPSATFEVLVSDVAVAAKDDRIRIGSETFVVQSAPMRDSQMLIWKLDVRPV